MVEGWRGGGVGPDSLTSSVPFLLPARTLYPKPPIHLFLPSVSTLSRFPESNSDLHFSAMRSKKVQPVLIVSHHLTPTEKNTSSAKSEAKLRF